MLNDPINEICQQQEHCFEADALLYGLAVEMRKPRAERNFTFPCARCGRKFRFDPLTRTTHEVRPFP